VTKTFERNEKKYLLTISQYESVFNEFSKYLKPDEYGEQIICNEYFDTDDYRLIRASIEKPPYKEKLRLRSYGIPNGESEVYLELKKKYDGIVFKRRVMGSLDEMREYINGKIPDNENQVLNEINYFLLFYHAKPKIFLAYNRIALIGEKNSGIRVTFDRKIRSRTENIDMSLGDFGEEFFTDSSVVMEVKVKGAMPLWMSEIITKSKATPTSFSKYGSVYKRFIAPKTIVFQKMILANVSFQEVINYV